MKNKDIDFLAPYFSKNFRFSAAFNVKNKNSDFLIQKIIDQE